MSPSLRIAVIGAGPGGLLCARMLQQHGLDAAVFEREASSSSRSQGGTLDLHRETGQAALRRAGLFDVFLKHARYEGQQTRLYERQGSLVMEKPPAEGDRPEIDRQDLRGLLLDSLPAVTVRWDHRLAEVVPLDAGGYELRFEGRDPQRFDVVVGADGAWSRVRPLLSPAVPRYVGSTLYELTIEDVDRGHPEIAAFVGHGTAVVEGDGKAIIIQRNSNGSVRLYPALTQSHDRDAPGCPPTTRAMIAAQFAGWNGIVDRLFAAATDTVRPWPIYALPVGHRWKPRHGITLIGDAAHLMPPAGEGANLALLDAVELADALAMAEAAVDGSGRDAALRAFEMTMFERGEAAALRAQAVMSEGVDMKAVLEEQQS